MYNWWETNYKTDIWFYSVYCVVASGRRSASPDLLRGYTALHYGKPGVQKSEKFISLYKALNMRVTTDLVRAWLGMKGNAIRS